MKEIKLITRLIKELIKENHGTYRWDWFPNCDVYDRMLLLIDNPKLLQEQLLRNEWMTDSPYWNVFIVGLYIRDNNENEFFHDEVTFLVDKTITVESFTENYKKSRVAPVQIEWINVVGNDGACYKNLEEPEGPFEFSNYDEEWESNVPENERDAAFYQAMMDEIKI